MIRRPPGSTRTDTLFPYTPLFRAAGIRPTLPAVESRTDPIRFHPNWTVNGLLSQVIVARARKSGARSEEHTSELQSLMRISYAVFCLKKNKFKQNIPNSSKQFASQTTYYN